MNAIITFITLLFISLVGLVVIKAWDLLPKKSNLYVFSIAYGLGVGLITAQLYVYARFGLSWNIWFLILPWVIFTITLSILRRPPLKLKMPTYKNVDKLFIGLFLGIVFSCFYTIFEALIRPLSAWDGWAAWLIKSKAFFLDSTITLPTMQYIRSDGPLVVSLLGAFVYVLLGQVDDTAVLLTSAAYYIFLLLFFYSVLKEKCSNKYALFFTFLLATTQTLIRQGGRFEAGQADLPLGYYIFACTLLFLEYLKGGKTKILLLLSVFLGITSLIKFEGFPFTLVIGALILFEIYRKKRYAHLFLLSFWLIPVFDWQNYKKIIHLEGIYYEGHHVIFSLQKIIGSLVGIIRELINIKSWNLLWLVYFYVTLCLFDKKNRDLVVIHIVVLSQLAMYLLVYFFTLGNAPESSIERLLVHIAALALLAIALAFERNSSFSQK